MCIKPVRQELFGVLFVVSGCVVMLSDRRAVRKDGVEASLFVYAVCFLTAFFGALYFMISSSNLKSLPPMTLLLCMSIYLFILTACVGKMIDHRV